MKKTKYRMRLTAFFFFFLSLTPTAALALDARACVASKGTIKDLSGRWGGVSQASKHVQTIMTLGRETFVHVCFLDPSDTLCDLIFVDKTNIANGEQYRAIGMAYRLRVFRDNSFEARLGDEDTATQTIVSGKCFRKNNIRY